MMLDAYLLGDFMLVNSCVTRLAWCWMYGVLYCMYCNLAPNIPLIKLQVQVGTSLMYTDGRTDGRTDERENTSPGSKVTKYLQVINSMGYLLGGRSFNETTPPLLVDNKIALTR